MRQFPVTDTHIFIHTHRHLLDHGNVLSCVAMTHATLHAYLELKKKKTAYSRKREAHNKTVQARKRATHTEFVFCSRFYMTVYIKEYSYSYPDIHGQYNHCLYVNCDISQNHNKITETWCLIRT